MEVKVPMKTSYATTDLHILDWEPTGDFGDAHPRSRLTAPYDALSFMGVFMHVEAWEIETRDETGCALDEVYRTVNPDLRADLDALHGVWMCDGSFQMATVQFPDESTPRLYMVFAFPHGG